MCNVAHWVSAAMIQEVGAVGRPVCSRDDMLAAIASKLLGMGGLDGSGVVGWYYLGGIWFHGERLGRDKYHLPK